MSKKHILIVDDNKLNRSILCEILGNDYDIAEAENGEDALCILQKCAQDIALVLLDLAMPVMDGYEVLSRMKADEVLSKIPVIVASGTDCSDIDKEVNALSLGAYDFIEKPYSPEVIRHRVANTIFLRETSVIVNNVKFDSLTGVLNKEYFYTLASEKINEGKDKKYDIICCDIDRFKLVNDLYGIRVGDGLLCHCAEAFSDFAKEDGLCGRINSDVFAMLTIHREDYSQALFSEILERINSYKINLNITVRYGIYTVDDSSIPVNIMCDRAIIAKSSVKGLYKNYFAYYDDEARQKLISEQYITDNMKKALSENRFEVYFQPKFELKTEKIIGAEALVRWNDPVRGMIFPNEFIPLFEKNGFITELDTFVWEDCAKKIRAWIDGGNCPVPISVNVSRTDIYNPKIDSILLSLVKKYHLSPKYINLEITESAYTENSEQLINAAAKLKRLGFLVEMDDFGTGYSSLNMLSELPIDVLKLDMRFMQNHGRRNGRSILSFIISLAKWLDLGVIAEGVETKEQADMLKSMGCECAQGYHLAMPLSAFEFEELLSKHERLHYVMKRENREEGSLTAANIYHPHTVLLAGEKDDRISELEGVLKDEYIVVTAENSKAAEKYVKDINSNICAALYFIGGEMKLESLGSFHEKCEAYSIPVITVHRSIDDMERAIELGATDCVLSPYVTGVVAAKIKNAVARAQVSEFKKERDINSAIMDMRKRAEQDSLTGLLNRAELENKVREFFASGERTECIFVIVDVDNFKEVNDQYGHATGDSVLQSVANALNYLFPETGVISRMGGDEFAVFIPYIIDREELELKIKKLCRAMEFDIQALKVTCSAGVSISPKDGLDCQALYEHSDIALLFAKRNGKSQYKFYEAGIESVLGEQLEQKASALLDNVSDAMFVCDTDGYDIIYINDTACHVLGMEKGECIGKKCYDIFWQREKNCERCCNIDNCVDCYYHEDAIMVDGKTKIHIKAKLGNWDGREVKIHYISLI